MPSPIFSPYTPYPINISIQNTMSSSERKNVWKILEDALQNERRLLKKTHDGGGKGSLTSLSTKYRH